MTPKERAVMQQALEALGELAHAFREETNIEYATTESPDPGHDAEEYQQAITAMSDLREALAVSEQRMEEQAEHTPYCKQAPMCKTPCGNPDCVEQAEQEPVAWGRVFDGDIIDCVCPEEHALNEGDYTIPLYTHPVRTKDLTDDELADACGWKLGDPMYEWVVDIGRWAIAADREKNK